MKDSQHFEEVGALKEKIKQLEKSIKEKGKAIAGYQALIGNMTVNTKSVVENKKVGLRAKKHKRDPKKEPFILHKREIAPVREL